MTIFWESCYFASCTKTTTWTDNPIITYVCDIYFYYKTKILKEKKRQEVALKGMGILKYPKMVPYIKRKQRVTAFRLTKNQLGQVLSIRPLFKNHISKQNSHILFSSRACLLINSISFSVNQCFFCHQSELFKATSASLHLNSERCFFFFFPNFSHRTR